MKISFLISILLFAHFCHAQRDIQGQLTELSKTDVGKKVIKQLQFVYRSQKNNPMDTIFTLNNLENDIVQNIEKEMKSYQALQQRNIEAKQETKQQIFLTKYSIQNMAEEISMLENEVKFSEDVFHQRQELISDQQKLIPQLVALKNDEETRMETYYPELNSSKDFLIQAQQFIRQLSLLASDHQEESVLQGQQTLDKQRGFLDESGQQVKEIVTNLSRLFTMTSKKLADSNPYVKIVGAFMPMIQQENFSQIRVVVDVLERLHEEVEGAIESLVELSTQRKDFFNTQRTRLKGDSEKWQSEIATIEPQSKQAREKLDGLRNELDYQKNFLTDLQQRVDDIQRQHDNAQITYENKHKAQLSDLSTLRSFKQLTYENLDAFEDFIKNKINI